MIVNLLVRLFLFSWKMKFLPENSPYDRIKFSRLSLSNGSEEISDFNFYALAVDLFCTLRQQKHFAQTAIKFNPWQFNVISRIPRQRLYIFSSLIFRPLAISCTNIVMSHSEWGLRPNLIVPKSLV